MHIAIMGTGGMGGYLGAKICHQTNHKVSFIARGAHLTALQQTGLHVISNGDQNFTIDPVSATDDPNEIGQVDLVIFAVKLYDTVSAAKSIKPLLHKDTVILTLQNGITSAKMIEEIIPNQTIFPASIFISAHVERPGVIKHNGGFNKFTFGAAPNQNEHSAALLKIKKIFDEIKINATIEEDVEKMLWEKFSLLAANSSIGTLLKCDAVEIAKNPDFNPIFKSALTEIVTLAQHLKINVDPDLSRKSMSDLIAKPENVKVIASQLTALQSGKKLELDYIQGEIHRLGLKHNIPTPLHSLALHLLTPHKNGQD